MTEVENKTKEVPWSSTRSGYKRPMIDSWIKFEDCSVGRRQGEDRAEKSQDMEGGRTAGNFPHGYGPLATYGSSNLGRPKNQHDWLRAAFYTSFLLPWPLFLFDSQTGSASKLTELLTGLNQVSETWVLQGVKHEDSGANVLFVYECLIIIVTFSPTTF